MSYAEMRQRVEASQPEILAQARMPFPNYKKLFVHLDTVHVLLHYLSPEDHVWLSEQVTAAIKYPIDKHVLSEMVCMATPYAQQKKLSMRIQLRRKRKLLAKTQSRPSHR